MIWNISLLQNSLHLEHDDYPGKKIAPKSFFLILQVSDMLNTW